MTTIKPLTQRAAWKKLAAHHKKIKGLHLRKLFAADSKRGERFTAEAAGLFLDYSKNRITSETLKLLLKLANESGLKARIKAMFSGEKINITENRGRAARRAARAQRTKKSSWMAQIWCRKSMRCSTRWKRFPNASAAARGKVSPANASRTSSTSASAVPIWARSWLMRR